MRVVQAQDVRLVQNVQCVEVNLLQLRLAMDVQIIKMINQDVILT